MKLTDAQSRALNNTVPAREAHGARPVNDLTRGELCLTGDLLQDWYEEWLGTPGDGLPERVQRARRAMEKIDRTLDKKHRWVRARRKELK